MCRIGLIAAVLFLLSFKSQAAVADHMACSHPVLHMPRTYQIDPRISPEDQQSYRDGFTKVANRSMGRISFLELSFTYTHDADILVLDSYYWSTGATWVSIPCGRVQSEIYVGSDVSQSYWATHEIMHTLGLADHITHSNNLSLYVNPTYCDDGSSYYSGIMSYCTDQSQWWEADDQYLFWRWF